MKTYLYDWTLSLIAVVLMVVLSVLFALLMFKERKRIGAKDVRDLRQSDGKH
jgi:hypothetical protein